jgi:hypothetical protein
MTIKPALQKNTLERRKIYTIARAWERINSTGKTDN